MWNAQDQKDDTQAHKSQIAFVVWDYDTSRFATGDKDGVVALWKLSKHNGLTHLYTHTPPRPSPATNCLFMRKTSPHLPWVIFGGGRLMHALWTDEKGAPPPPSAPHKGLVSIDLTHQAQGPLASLHQSTSGDEIFVVTDQPNAILMTFRCIAPLSLERSSLRIVSPALPSLTSVPSSPSLTNSPSTSTPLAATTAGSTTAVSELILCWAEDELVLVDQASNSSLSVWNSATSTNTSPSFVLSTKSMFYWSHFTINLTYHREKSNFSSRLQSLFKESGSRYGSRHSDSMAVSGPMGSCH